MKTQKFHKKLLPISIALIMASPVFAQEEAPNDNNKTDYIEQIVVTGTASGTAIRKVDASYASTSLSAEDILKLQVKLIDEANETLITSLHSVEYAKKYFTRIIALKDGEIFFDLKPREITEEILSSLYSFKEMG